MVIMALCSLVLGGGLAIPFAVKERITGVDPFQLTTFAWLLVGVILIVAKSRYVTEWPWHDFLRGRVVCQSVSDLADVTGVDAQVILTMLLHNEQNTTLVTRGPYNGMFSRRAEAISTEGFSIDVAVQLSTMLASGFIILKVLSQSGEHLITLDVRKGTSTDYATHDGLGVKYLACLDLGKRDLNEDEEDENDYQDEKGRLDEEDLLKSPSTPTHVLYLVHGELNYTKVLGLYIADSYFG